MIVFFTLFHQKVLFTNSISTIGHLLIGVITIILTLSLGLLAYYARSIRLPWKRLLLLMFFLLSLGSWLLFPLIVTPFPNQWLLLSLTLFCLLTGLATLVILPSLLRSVMQHIAIVQQQPAAQIRLAGILNTTEDAIISINERQEITLFNQGAERIFGYPAADILGQPLDKLLPASVAELHRRHVAAFAHAPEMTRKMGERRSIFGLRADGKKFSAEASITKLVLNDQIIFTIILRDISERVQVEAALEESERRFHGIFDQTFQFIGLCTPAGIILEANQTSLDFGNLKREQVLARPLWEAAWWNYSPEAQVILQEAIRQAAAGQFVRYETAIHGEYQTAPIDFSIKPLYDQHGQVQMLITEGREITQQKQAEQRLRSSLEEKDVLLKEVHHRVKNNLQIIISLLRLHIHATNDPIVAEPLHDCQNRVLAMALVHEQLYGSNDLAQIDFTGYIRRLASSILRTYEPQSDRIHLEIQGTPNALIDIETAIPLGLILTELIVNSIKHAFPDQQAGIIMITFAVYETSASLLIQDNGIGIATTMRYPRLTPSIGLKLVQRLVGQLEGTLTFENQNGMCIEVSIPLKAREQQNDEFFGSHR